MDINQLTEKIRKEVTRKQAEYLQKTYNCKNITQNTRVLEGKLNTLKEVLTELDDVEMQSITLKIN